MHAGDILNPATIQAYELVLEGLRQALTVTPTDAAERPDLVRCYLAFARLAGQDALQLLPLAEPAPQAAARHC